LFANTAFLLHVSSVNDTLQDTAFFEGTVLL